MEGITINGDAGRLFDVIIGQRDHRLILGVDGLSRSGKTTFVADLRRGLIDARKSVQVFHLDDHIVERKRRYDTGSDPWNEYYHLQWDVEFLRHHLFAKLREHEELNLPFYNTERDEQITNTVCLPPNSIVIVEGVFLQRPEWREFMDFVVYLNCPRETRFQRESADARQNIQKFIERYWKAEDHYLDSVHPLDLADMVIGS